MKFQVIIFFIVCNCILIFNCSKLKINVTPDLFTHSRSKRTLVFPGNKKVQLITGVGLPVQLDDESVTIGMVLKAGYRLPANSTDVSNNYYVNSVVQAKTASINRWDLYEIASDFINRSGFIGKPCLMRMICENAAIPFDKNSGIFDELFHLLLTPSSTKDLIKSYEDNEYLAAEKYGKQKENCNNIFSECNANLMTIFSKIISY